MEVPFAQPCIDEDEIEEVTAVLRSGWLTTGPVAAKFEVAFQRYLGTTNPCLAVSSCTAGIGLVLESLEKGEVITSALSFPSPAMEAHRLGHDVRFADVDPVTMNLTPDTIAPHLSGRTRAVIVPHHAGVVAPLKAIREFLPSYVCLVSDAAHALGAVVEGQKVGAAPWVDATVFSFYATKGITTGDGGMVVLGHTSFGRNLLDYVDRARSHGMMAAPDRYTRPGASWEYDVQHLGRKANLPDLLAAVGLAQLRKADKMLARRRTIGLEYQTAFGCYPEWAPWASGGCHLYQMLVDPNRRADVLKGLACQGVGSSVHFHPTYRHSFWSSQDRYDGMRLPVTERLSRSLLSLPLYPTMSEDAVHAVINAVRQVI